MELLIKSRRMLQYEGLLISLPPVSSNKNYEQNRESSFSEMTKTVKSFQQF